MVRTGAEWCRPGLHGAIRELKAERDGQIEVTGISRRAGRCRMSSRSLPVSMKGCRQRTSRRLRRASIFHQAQLAIPLHRRRTGVKEQGLAVDLHRASCYM
jgi:hypothetical protein